MMTLKGYRLKGIFSTTLLNAIACFSSILTQCEVCGVVFHVTCNLMGLNEPGKLRKTNLQISSIAMHTSRLTINVKWMEGG